MADTVPDTKPINLVIVDDDTFLLNIYATRFQKSGFLVTSFADPVAALEKIKGGLKPDILLMDIMMPGMTGWELLQHIRTDKLFDPSTAVIVLTNQSDSTDLEKGKSLNVDGYVIKATSIPSEVVDTVVATYNKHRGK